MSNGKRSKAGVAAVAVFVSVSLAACEPGTSPHGGKRVQDRSQPDGPSVRAALQPQPLRAQFDVASGRAWALHVDRVDVRDTKGAMTSISLPGWTWATEPYACPPDLAITRGGDVLVTSNVTPAIWRIDSATLEVTRHELAVAGNAGRDVGFSRLFYSAREDVVLAAGALDNSLWHIDRSLSRAQPIALSPALPGECVLSMLPGGAANALCLQIEQSDWIVMLSDDLRSGVAQPAKCSNGRPRDASRGGIKP